MYSIPPPHPLPPLPYPSVFPVPPIHSLPPPPHPPPTLSHEGHTDHTAPHLRKNAECLALAQILQPAFTSTTTPVPLPTSQTKRSHINNCKQMISLIKKHCLSPREIKLMDRERDRKLLLKYLNRANQLKQPNKDRPRASPQPNNDRSSQA